jgi:hypothetical protein
MLLLHQIDPNALAVSGASIFACTFLRQLRRAWAYFRRNGLQGKILIEWHFGPTPKES